ncbi:unnamed protein product [Orchesella dallaii]|uniref:Uncharacterized protein n=1 Tax=Orchesella dallaii TaxID=48710 RepID=A0ABP1RVM9_9HEXA
MLRIVVKVLMLITIASSISSEKIAKCDKPCLVGLYSQINKQWERYILYFFTSETFHGSQLSPHESLQTRVVATSENMIATGRGDYRYSNTINIIIIQVVTTKYIEEMAKISEIVVPSRSLILFLLINENTWMESLSRSLKLANWHPDLPVFAALKLILTLPKQPKCNQHDLSIMVICSGYCFPVQEPLNNFLKHFQTVDLYSLHHSLFWNANGRNLPAIINDIYEFIKNTPKEKQGACLSPTNRINFRCRNSIMTMLTYGEIHNITIDLQRLTMKNILKYNVMNVLQGPEQVTFSLIATAGATPFAFTQMVFNSFGSESLVYCPQLNNLAGKRNFAEFEIWYEPVTLHIWLSILSFFILATVCCYVYHHNMKSVLRSMFNYWAAVFGAPHNPRYFILVCCLCFFLSQLYTNGLTSIITVTEIPKGFLTIKELLQADYKILFNSARALDSVEEIYGNEFKRLGLSIKGAFERFDLSNLDSVLQKLQEKDGRFAFITETSMSNYYAALSIAKLRNGNITKSDFTCYVVKQILSQAQCHTVLETENQYWIYVTMQRIRAAGLQHKWIEWSEWHSMLISKLFGQKFRPGPGFVDRPKFLAMQIAVAEFPKACLSKLFPNFNKDWEKYVLYFLDNKEPLRDQPSPDNLLKTRIVAAEDMKGLDRGAYRFSDTFNVVIHQLKGDHMKQMAEISYINDIFVPSRSIYLFTTANNGETTRARNLELANWHPKLQVFPALKLILTLPQSNECNRNESSVTVICSGYCSAAPRAVDDFEKGFATAGLYAVHHFQFWNGNRKVIPAFVYDTYLFIESTPKEKQGVCLSQTHRIYYKCKEGIMNMLTFVYCPRIRKTGEDGLLLEFGVWYEPFTPEIWLSILFLLVFGVVCCYIILRNVQSVFVELLKSWAALFGAEASPRYFILISSFAFLLTQIYSNGLTSIVTVGKPPEGFKTIQELLQAGYKILLDVANHRETMENRFGDEFRRLGLSTEGAFEFSDTSDLVKIVGELIENNARRTFPADTSMAHIYKALSKKVLQQNSLTKGKFTCFVVEQTLSEEMAISVTETENQHWVYVTSQRIRASGLLYKWSEWSQWHQLLKESLLDGKYKGSSDTVDRPKFLAMQLLWGGLLIISVAIFCVETKCIGYCKEFVKASM